jgi:hypothetical protein
MDLLEPDTPADEVCLEKLLDRLLAVKCGQIQGGAVGREDRSRH